MPCSRGELLRCAHRVFHAVAIIQQVTTMHFLRRSAEQVREREGRLRAFSRTVSHELKNRLGAIHGAYSPLREPWGEAAQREDRKSTRLNSSHANISYAVFCLKKKTH